MTRKYYREYLGGGTTKSGKPIKQQKIFGETMQDIEKQARKAGINPVNLKEPYEFKKGKWVKPNQVVEEIGFEKPQEQAPPQQEFVSKKQEQPEIKPEIQSKLKPSPMGEQATPDYMKNIYQAYLGKDYKPGGNKTWQSVAKHHRNHGTSLQELTEWLKNKETQEKARNQIANRLGKDVSNIKMPGELEPPELTPTSETPKGEEMKAPGEPDLPERKAPEIIKNYTNSMLASLETKRKNLEKTYQQRIQNIRDDISASQEKLDKLTDKTEDIIEKTKPLKEPFREDLEKRERERLKIEENYFANQETLQEMENLLTTAQEEIKAMEGETGLKAIRQPRINKFKEDMAARVGVLEAVMAARNNQITTAQNMIDRSMTAIQADREDQLSYYQSLFNFYDKQRDEEGNKLISLKKEEKEFLNAQINLIQADLEESQANVDYIKKLMLDPNTANIVEKAGVKLTDTPAQVSKKFADYGYRQDVVNMDNKMENNGWQYLPDPAMIAGKDRENLRYLKDSRGNSRVYYKPPEPEEMPGGGGGRGSERVGNGSMVELEDGSKVDITTVDGLVNALGQGYRAADLRTYLDTNISGLTGSSIDSLISNALEEYEETGGEVEEGEEIDKKTQTNKSIYNYIKALKQAGYTKDEAENNMIGALKDKLKLGKNDSLPSKYDDIIEEAKWLVYNPDKETKRHWAGFIGGKAKTREELEKKFGINQ